MSAPHREMMTGLIDDLAGQIVAGIAADRKMSPDRVRQIVNGAPYNDTEALRLKLVDRVGYYDQALEESMAKAAGAGIVGLQGYSFTSGTINLNLGVTGFISKFFRKTDPAYATRNKSKIALIFGAGDIVSYKNKVYAGFGESGMSADKIVAAFEAAEKDNAIAAVVFRVDSSGGSPVAAETIRRALMRVQQKGKPVIVSMSGYAASGGYWIAAPADKIVAQPATITGSIGVFGGKFVLAQLWEKIGVNWDSVSSGDNARMWSVNAPFTGREKARFEAMLDNIYESFIVRVMAGRKMTREQVLAVAEGYVWTGRQAKEKGLVDELGGLDTAIELARTAAKLPPGQEVHIERFPAPKSTLELFIQLATEGVSLAPNISIRAEDILRGLKAEMDDEAGILKSPQILVH